MPIFSARVALERLEEYFPGESITELPGNPNILGEYVFLVGDKRIAVNPDNIIEEEHGMPERF